MINVVQLCEPLQTLNPLIVTGNAEAKDVFPDRRITPAPADRSAPVPNPNALGERIAYRMIQNVGGTTVNVSYSKDSTAASYHYQLPAGASFSIYTLERVSVFGAGAWSIATLEMVRPKN